MSKPEQRIVFSFRARLAVVMAALLLATLATVQLLNLRAQSEVQEALDRQKETVNETLSAHMTEITQATNFALMSLGSQEYIYEILAKPEYKDKFNRDRVRHILVVEDNGTIKDSSERALKGKQIKPPAASSDESLGVVEKGDPVALYDDDEDHADAEQATTYWVRVETKNSQTSERERWWIAIVVSDRQVTTTVSKGLNDVADVVESTAGVRWKLTLGVFALAVLLMFMLVWRFTRPVQVLSEAAERVAGGDLDFNVQIKRRDEIGQLASTFNQMISGLKAKADLEERLNNAERAAVIGRLTSAVAHEIRNPLNFINLSIDHVRSKFAPEDERSRDRFDRLLASIKEEIGRLNRLVNDVLNFGRPANLNVRTFDLRQLLDQVVGIVRAQAEQQAVEVDADLPPDPVTIEADAEKLKSCFVNIVINAVQAMPEGGRLAVTLDTSPESVRVRVTDTGVGIPGEALDRVFEPYYSTKDTGTGLGLAVTKKIVDEHEGHIRVESTPGGGTTFEVDLPRARSQAPASERFSSVVTR